MRFTAPEISETVYSGMLETGGIFAVGLGPWIVHGSNLCYGVDAWNWTR